VGGKKLPLSLPLPVVLGGKIARGKFVVSPETPVSLLGQHLLQEFGTCISSTPIGIQLIVIGMSLIKILENKKEGKKIPEELSDTPHELWSTSGDEVGLLKSAEPVVIQTKGGTPPSIQQYPIVSEAISSIGKQIDKFLKERILKECRSPYDTPILPVSKNRLDNDRDPEYRFVQDLRAVNEHVIAPHPVIPDPTLILNSNTSLGPVLYCA